MINSTKPCFSNDDLASGRVVLLSDSLDELALDTARASVISKVLEFNSAFPKCQVILTSRDYAYLKSLEGLKPFTQFRLFPIDYRQAEQILKRFEKKAKSAVGQIKRNPPSPNPASEPRAQDE